MSHQQLQTSETMLILPLSKMENVCFLDQTSRTGRQIPLVAQTTFVPILDPPKWPQKGDHFWPAPDPILADRFLTISNVHVWALGPSCEAPAAPTCEAPGAPKPPGLHTTAREPTHAHSRVLVLKTPPEIHERTHQREEEENCEKKKSEILAVRRRGVQGRESPAEGRGKGVRRRGVSTHHNTHHNTHTTTTQTTQRWVPDTGVLGWGLVERCRAAQRSMAKKHT